jgi:hypothetical protein
MTAILSQFVLIAQHEAKPALFSAPLCASAKYVIKYFNKTNLGISAHSWGE